MPKFNVLVGVVEVIEADDAKAAIRNLEVRLTKDGYETYSDGTTQLPHAFESEETA